MIPGEPPSWLEYLVTFGMCVVGISLVLYPEHYIQESERPSSVPEWMRFPLSVPVVRAIGVLFALGGALGLALVIRLG
jgi:drug/metabolite transporter (DMT)-like permease